MSDNPQFTDQVDQFETEAINEEYRQLKASQPRPFERIITDEDELMERERDWEE